MVESRLNVSGEWVFHIPMDGDRQALFMDYQYIPDTTNPAGDFMISQENPTIFGHIDHFETEPKIYRVGNSARPAGGSQFEVRGLIFDVKGIDLNHEGGITMTLVQNSNCQETRCEFFDEVEELFCSSERR